MIHSFQCVMNYTLADQKVDEKHIILTHESMKEQNAFLMTGPTSGEAVLCRQEMPG